MQAFLSTLLFKPMVLCECECMMCDDFQRTGVVTLMRCIRIRRASKKRWMRRRHNSVGYMTIFVGHWRKWRLVKTTLTTISTSLFPTSAYPRIALQKWRSSIGRRVVEWQNGHERSPRSALLPLLSANCLYEYNACFASTKVAGIDAGHSIECKLTPATWSPSICICTLWSCDLDLLT